MSAPDPVRLGAWVSWLIAVAAGIGWFAIGDCLYTRVMVSLALIIHTIDRTVYLTEQG